MSEFDLEEAMKNGGKCRTKNRIDCTILKTDLRGKQPLLVIRHTEKQDQVVTHSLDGKFFYNGDESESDLVNIPRRIKLSMEIKIWKTDDGKYYGNIYRECFARSTPASLVAIRPITIDCEEGEGL